jgi:hypothetical protein
MFQASGKGWSDPDHPPDAPCDTRFFDFKPSFFGQTMRVEWELDATYIVIPAAIAGALIKNGWARLMTSGEVDGHNSKLGSTAPPKEEDPPSAARTRPRKAKEGDEND